MKEVSQVPSSNIGGVGGEYADLPRLDHTAIWHEHLSLPKHGLASDSIIRDGRTVVELFADLTAHVPSMNVPIGKLINTFRMLTEFFGTCDLSGKRILDIACGARVGSGMGHDSYRWEPWRARLAQALGAEVTGFDIRPSAPEMYRHIQRDLVSDGLGDVPPDSIDLVLWCGFDSPQSVQKSSSIVARYGRLHSEVTRALAPEGGVYVDSWCYKRGEMF